jgi:hypothetical protein
MYQGVSVLTDGKGDNGGRSDAHLNLLCGGCDSCTYWFR